jgi:hypothetical protein
MPDSKRRLFIPGYYAGFSNNKMALDIAVILAHLTGRVLAPYRFRLSPPRFPVEVKPGRAPEPFLVTDLFEIPVPWSDEHLLETWISVPGARECAWAPVFDSMLCFPATLPRDDEGFRHFRNGRQHVHILDEREDEAPDLHINTLTLGHYSYFFYLDEARRREVVELMRRLRPKRPYREAADRIAAGLVNSMPSTFAAATSAGIGGRIRASSAPPPSAARRSSPTLPRAWTATLRSSSARMTRLATSSSAPYRNTSAT